MMTCQTTWNRIKELSFSWEIEDAKTTTSSSTYIWFDRQALLYILLYLILNSLPRQLIHWVMRSHIHSTASPMGHHIKSHSLGKWCGCIGCVLVYWEMIIKRRKSRIYALYAAITIYEYKIKFHFLYRYLIAVLWPRRVVCSRQSAIT